MLERFANLVVEPDLFWRAGVDELDDHTTNELHGDEIGSDAEVDHFLAKENWSSLSRHFVSLKIASLYRYIRDGDRGRAAFLGSGTGFEIGPLCREGYRPARLFAPREEHSGLEPDGLDLERLRRLCDRDGYRLEVHTMWELPVDYFERVSRNWAWLERVMIRAIDAFSFVLRPFRFGNFAGCRLTRRRA